MQTFKSYQILSHLIRFKSDPGCRNPDAPAPVRICFPKNFAGRFDPIHQAGHGIENLPRVIKGVRKLAELAPHFVRVTKKPCKRDEVVNKGDVLETMGLAMCSSWTEDRGFLRWVRVTSK